MSKEHLNYLRRKTADEAELWAADRIERLEAERDKLTERVAELGMLYNYVFDRSKEIAAERDELKADAMRYRWLMNDDGHNALMATLASLCATDDTIKPQMDAAIDAVIAKVEKHAQA